MVAAAFADIVAGTFNSFQTAADGTLSPATANDSVVSTSVIFIVGAVVLTFPACAVFFKRTKRNSFMLWVPLFTMAAVTFTALVMTI